MDFDARTVAGSTCESLDHISSKPLLDEDSSESITTINEDRVPTSIMDLPRELRDEIWSLATRSDKTERLKIWVQRSQTGQIRFKGHTMPLCYAVPISRQEILSVFYSQNTFSVCLHSIHDRNALRTWVRHQSTLLKGMTDLVIVHKLIVHEKTPPVSYSYEPLAGLNYFRIRLAEDGGSVIHSEPKQPLFQDFCLCKMDGIVEERLSRVPAGEDTILPLRGKQHPTPCSNLP